ncbi:MAG TPA: hypothetical protein GX723_11285 [Thermoanaerobacterales bacterium]|nr:hypothetical protein [Thermoanaerobacterales bacterium]
MSKKILSLILILALAFSIAGFANAKAVTTSVEITTTAEVDTTLDRANALKDLGLFKGTGSGFDLDRAPTRTEAIVMLLRMLGEEKKAEESSYTNPFTDVPSWATQYISYAYNKGYTNGTSVSTFGSDDLATPEQFFTFMLRALGYSDKDGDFDWSASVQKAESLSIVASGNYTDNETFNRGDCVDIIYSVLSANKKDDNITLAETLIAKESIDGTIAAKYGFGKPTALPDDLVDLSSKTFTNNKRLCVLSAKSIWNDNAAIKLEIAPRDFGIKATSIYLSEDGINYKALKMSSKRDSNNEEPYVYAVELREMSAGNGMGHNYHILNLKFDTTYTVCVETSQNEFITPITIKTANSKAAAVSGFGAPYGNKSSNGMYTSAFVGINLSLENEWSYQFYRWTPGSNPAAISGASGIAIGSTVIFHELTSEDLNSFVFWRVINDDGVIIESIGYYVELVAGMPPQ